MNAKGGGGGSGESHELAAMTLQCEQVRADMEHFQNVSGAEEGGVGKCW